MSFDYDVKSNIVAMISNYSQSQSKLQLDKQIGLMKMFTNNINGMEFKKLIEKNQDF